MERLICPEGVAFNVVLVFYPVRGVGVFFVTFSRSLSLSLFFFNWVKLTDRDLSHLFYGVRISNA